MLELGEITTEINTIMCVNNLLKIIHMTWEYISGFFDADGSITAAKASKNGSKVIQISFANNELNILKDIQQFILKDLNIKGAISKKTPKQESHSINYELKYVYQNGYKVSLKLNSKHKKKKARIELYKEIQKLTPRNGKYTTELTLARNQKLEEFFKA